MYKEFSQGDDHQSMDAAKFMGFAAGENCPAKGNVETKKFLGKKKVLTRRGNHIGESMKLSARRQRLLDLSLTNELNRLEEKYSDYVTENSIKKSR